MRYLILLPALLLAGCGSITRSEYEKANGLPVLTEHEKDGTTVVVYGPDHDPQINPVTGAYTCPHGVRVAKFRDGLLVKKWFQADEVKP